MKGLFITAENGKSVKDMEGGISLKIRNQMQAFSKRGFQIKEFVMPFGYTASLMNKIRYRLPFSNIRPVWEYHEEFADADFIYLRRPNVMTKYLRSVLQNIKKANKKCKILMEIPTYPYDKELLHETFGFFMLFKDRYNRKRIKKLIDTYVTLSDDKELLKYNESDKKYKDLISAEYRYINSNKEEIYKRSRRRDTYLCSCNVYEDAWI